MSQALSNRYLALGLEDEHGKVLLWDIGKEQDRQIATGHNKNSGYGVSAVAFADDGATLITAGRDGAVKIWDVAGGKELRAIAKAYPGWIETLALTRDGKRLACAGQDGIIRHWDPATGTELDAQPGYGRHVSEISVTADGSTAVTSYYHDDNHLRIWDLNTGRERPPIALPGPSAQATMAPDGRTIVVNLADTIKAWTVATGQETRLPELPAGLKSRHLRFAADGKSLVTFQADTVTLLDWPSCKIRRSFKLPEPLQKPGETLCNAAALAPDGLWLATLAERSWYREERGLKFGYGADCVLDLWNATTGEHVHRLADSQGRTTLFTANGDLLVDGRGTLYPLGGDKVALKGEFHLIDPLTGRLKISFEPAPLLPGAMGRYNASLGLTPDGRSVCCAGNDGVIHIYETATGKIRRSLSRHRDYVSSLAFTADGRRLLSASLDMTALVWDISLIGRIPKRAASPTPDEENKLWNTLLETDAKTSYEAMAILAAHPPSAVAWIRAHIKPVASSPDDATLDRLVIELGDSKFAVREHAARALDRLGEAAVAGLRARLARSLPLETHLRIVPILNKHDPLMVTPAHLREIRALELLEQLNTPESRTELTVLANGAPNARLTRAAAGSLARLKGLDEKSGK